MLGKLSKQFALDITTVWYCIHPARGGGSVFFIDANMVSSR